jgi:hypothetical protein
MDNRLVLSVSPPDGGLREIEEFVTKLYVISNPVKSSDIGSGALQRFYPMARYANRLEGDRLIISVSAERSGLRTRTELLKNLT